MSSRGLEISAATIANKGRSRVEAMKVYPLASNDQFSGLDTIGIKLSVQEARKLALSILLLTDSPGQVDPQGYVRITGDRHQNSVSILAKRTKQL